MPSECCSSSTRCVLTSGRLPRGSSTPVTRLIRGRGNGVGNVAGPTYSMADLSLPWLRRRCVPAQPACHQDPDCVAKCMQVLDQSKVTPPPAPVRSNLCTTASPFVWWTLPGGALGDTHGLAWFIRQRRARTHAIRRCRFVCWRSRRTPTRSRRQLSQRPYRSPRVRFSCHSASRSVSALVPRPFLSYSPSRAWGGSVLLLIPPPARWGVGPLAYLRAACLTHFVWHRQLCPGIPREPVGRPALRRDRAV